MTSRFGLQNPLRRQVIYLTPGLGAEMTSMSSPFSTTRPRLTGHTTYGGDHHRFRTPHAGIGNLVPEVDGRKRVPETMIASHDVVDSIVQASTVDLFQAYDIAVAPRASTRGAAGRSQSSELTGIVNFNVKGGGGTLMLEIPLDVLNRMKMDPGLSIQTRDWVRELTNQLMGRIKNRLLHFQHELRSGLPTVLERRMFEQRPALTESATIYGFRTLRGEVQVILDGTIDESTFVYSGKVDVRSEGEIILF